MKEKEEYLKAKQIVKEYEKQLNMTVNYPLSMVTSNGDVIILTKSSRVDGVPETKIIYGK